MIFELFTIISPVLICALIGYGWCRKGWSFDVDQTTKLVTYIGTPCLVFTTLVNVEIEKSAFTQMAFGTAVSVIGFGVIGAIILKIFRLHLPTYLPPVVWANMGNMGIPLCLFAFGQEGLALAITYFTIDVVMMFTIGIAVSAGTFSIMRILKLPFIYAVVAAIVVMMNDLDVPRWIINSTELLGNLTIPLMLIMLGVSLASLKISSMKRATAISVMRLGLGFLVGWATAVAFGMEGAARGVMILESAMPVAVFNYLFAMQYNRAPEEIAGMIVISTLLSFLTLPALLLFVL